MMKFRQEEDVLNEEFRKQVLQEILAPENMARKQEARKRYEIYKDKTKKFVIERLKAQGLKSETIQSMQNRCSNISILKKIVDKLSSAYTAGVSRSSSADDEATQLLENEFISEYEDFLNFDKKQKKADRYRELFKNTMIQVVPVLDQVASRKEGRDVYKISQRVLAPWQYDVIEDCEDREEARVVILSDYGETARHAGAYTAPYQADVHSDVAGPVNVSNRRDEIIADAPIDQNEGGQMEFIWWSGAYHFTTNEHGQIIPEKSPEDLENPIGELNFVKVAQDQDGSFWAEGGDDLVEGAILVNVIITDMFAIAYQQGWGQFYIIGKGISHSQDVGPHNAMVFEIDDETEPGQRPEVGVVSANPPLGEWMASIEQYVALLLSTNNLSTGTVSVSLNAQSFPSGIAMIIDAAESVNDVNEAQSMFLDAERHEWHLVKKWHNLFFDKNLLVPKLQQLGPVSDDFEVLVKFHEPKPVTTEKERLENIEKRKDLGINLMVELIQMDDPDLTRQEAEEKLMRIAEEKMKRMESMTAKMLGGNELADDDPDDNSEDDDDDDQGQ